MGKDDQVIKRFHEIQRKVKMDDEEVQRLTNRNYMIKNYMFSRLKIINKDNINKLKLILIN